MFRYLQHSSLLSLSYHSFIMCELSVFLFVVSTLPGISPLVNLVLETSLSASNTNPQQYHLCKPASQLRTTGYSHCCHTNSRQVASVVILQILRRSVVVKVVYRRFHCKGLCYYVQFYCPIQLSLILGAMQGSYFPGLFINKWNK